MYDNNPQQALDAALAELEGIRFSVDDAVIKSRSHDYYWYSPILKEQLKDKAADVIIMPKTQDEIVRVAAAAARHGVPITIRGGGTGNYGQCVPLEGGIVLDITGLKEIIEIGDGWVRCEAGVRISKLDDACAETGQQLLMYPSTRKMATIGGFLSGGSGGIGSLRHGLLQEDGNVRWIKVLTLEEEPKIIELHDTDIQKVQHAYGTNGIILELEIALTAYTDWLHSAALFPSYDAALRCSMEIVDQGLDCYLLTVVERRFAQYYTKFGDLFPSDQDAIFAMIAPEDVARFAQVSKKYGGHVTFSKTLDEMHADNLPPAYECGWNHTTLSALKVDPDWTYIQLACARPFDPVLAVQQLERYGENAYWHHEFVRQGGELQVFGLPIVRFKTSEDIYGLIEELEADGGIVFDPHVVTIEDGGMKTIDDSQIAFKKLADPFGLMNPGKTRGWTADMAIQKD